MVRGRSEIIDIGDGALQVFVEGDGPTVVLHPGCGRPATDFEALMGPLAEAGYQAVAVNPRGVMGSTPAPGFATLHHLASDLAAVIRARGEGPVWVVGHALGNRVVRCLGRDQPALVRGTVLLAAGGRIEPHVRSQEVWGKILGLPRDAPARVSAIADAFFAPGSDPRVWLDWWPDAIRLQSLASVVTPLEEWWDGGRSPMLVVQGDEDRMAPPANGELLRQEFPWRVTLVPVPAAGHALISEQPEAVSRAVVEWLKSELSQTPKPSTGKGFGATPAAAAVLERRSAETHAAFALRHLRPGMRLLDLGCGPGTITVGLAAAVAPGEVIGVDLHEASLVEARARCAGLTNVRFIQGDACHLDIDGDSMDVVFMYTLLMNLPEPERALAEAHRVLRPGGMIAVCDGDWAGNIQAPTFQLLESVAPIIEEANRLSGTDTRFGRHHRRHLREAGFERIEAGSSTEAFGTSAATQAYAEQVISLMQEKIATMSVKPTPPQVALLSAASRAWGTHPDAFYSRVRCEAVAWKPCCP